MSNISSISSNNDYAASMYRANQHQQKPDASKMANDLFAHLDTNNQGYIDENQLTSAFGTSDSAKSNASKLFAAMDGNTDGKVTKEELAASLQEKIDAASSQFHTRMNMQEGMSHAHGDMPPPPQGGGMPPGPPPSGRGQDNDGMTQDQLTAASKSEQDTQASSLLSSLATNFSAADADGDGEVTQKEALAYQQQQQKNETTAASNNSTSNASSTTRTSGSSATANSDNTSAHLQHQLDSLMRMYNIPSNTTNISSMLTSA
jgi:Ca2+-binding EF-hand superfamily protein